MSTISASPSTTSSTSSPESPSDAPNNAEDSDIWTRHQENLFENAWSVHDLDILERWENIAALVPGKDACAVKRHYEFLGGGCEEHWFTNYKSLPAYPKSVENRLDCSAESSYVKNGVVGDGSSNGSSGSSGGGKVGNYKGSIRTETAERRRKKRETEKDREMYVCKSPPNQSLTFLVLCACCDALIWFHMLFYPYYYIRVLGFHSSDGSFCISYSLCI